MFDVPIKNKFPEFLETFDIKVSILFRSFCLTFFFPFTNLSYFFYGNGLL
jgi:hypothetical protein